MKDDKTIKKNTSSNSNDRDEFKFLLNNFNTELQYFSKNEVKKAKEKRSYKRSLTRNTFIN